MNSLKFKILGLTLLITVIAIGLTAWHNLRTQQAMMDRFAEQNCRVLGETIRNSIITTMASGENDEVVSILRKISHEPAIESVRIFDESGRILLSSRTEEVGDLVDSAELLAYRARRSQARDHHREGLNSSVLPIHNSPLCHQCHDSSQEILGILNVHLSLGELQAIQAKGRQATVFSSAAMLAVLILSISAFILFYVDKPIRKLVAAMNHVELGDFDRAHTLVHSSREMSQLAGKFNLMVERLKGLIETTVKNEREIAVAQEKLIHHDEIRNMNITLEERLREIEYLNLTLEERIEEIEEANYKISDLASDLKAKNTNLESAVRRLSALYKMGLAINSTMDLERLFDLLIRKTRDSIGARVGYLLLLDQEAWCLRVGAAVGIPEHVDVQTRLPIKVGGVSHWVIENGQPLLLQNLEKNREFSRISRLGFTRETVICAPLVIKDQVVGTITMANKVDGTSFDAEDLELLSTIAAQASVAIKNARLYEEQEQTYLSTVQALVSAIEASDPYTRGHSDRVTRYSLALAREMGVPAEKLKRLEQAAILHDIGKIGIDLALLNKEEALSEGDREILNQHPLIGVKILEPIHFLRGVTEIIEQHHERVDGQGYPRGLRGDQILLEAKILAVADTYDAMTSDRPYRRALSHETTLREIGDHSGAQFDPVVVQAFVRLWRQEEAPC